MEVIGYTPLLTGIKTEFGIPEAPQPLESGNFEAVIITVGRDKIRELDLEQLIRMINDKPVLIGVKGIFSAKEAAESGKRTGLPYFIMRPAHRFPEGN